MTDQEKAAITARLSLFHTDEEIQHGFAVARASGATDADEVLSYALGAILGVIGGRLGVEPGFVKSLVAKDEA